MRLFPFFFPLLACHAGDPLRSASPQADPPPAPPSPPSPPPADPPDAPLVTATLVPDGPVTPGVTGWVGVRHVLRPGWHIYWENPGDSGLATRVDLELPAGWRAGPTAFPGPTRFEVAGGLVNYGYADEVTLLVPVTAPADAPPGAVAIQGEARWLCCQDDRCVPGSARLSGSLTVGSGPTGALDAARARLPRPAADAGVAAAWSGHELRIDVPGGRAELFPSLDLEPALRGQAIEAAGSSTRVRLQVDPAALGPDPRVVIATDSGYVTLDTSPPESP